MSNVPERLEVNDRQRTPLVLTLESTEPHEQGTLAHYVTETGDKRASVVIAEGLDPKDVERAILARLTCETAVHDHAPHDTEEPDPNTGAAPDA